ncbi:MAG: hypothetical protein M3Q73_01080 [bacterium]|nr:hypothetical protein [bacterium]
MSDTEQLNQNNEQPHNIDKLGQEIYNRGFTNDVTSRAPLSKPDVPVEMRWKHDSPGFDIPPPKPVIISIFKRIFVISAIFFVLSALVALIVFYGGFNIISANKVDMEFVGPVSIAASDELAFDIIIKNQNTTDLLNTELFLDFPDGTKKSIGELTQDLNHLKEDVGTVTNRSSARRTVRAVLFGKTQEMKEIKVTLQYNLKSSNGVYKKEKVYKVSIESTPITLTVRRPTEVASGQDLRFEVDVVSNATVPLTNLLLVAEYPFGFQFGSANPAPSVDSNLWRIPVLQPGEKKTYIISGKSEGEEGDERVFRFDIGAQSTVNLKAIATQYLSQAESVRIRRPPVSITISLGESTAKEVTAAPGREVNAHVSVINNMPTQFADVKVEVTFGGNAFSPTSPIVEDALYRLPTQTISWDRTIIPTLSLLEPGDKVDFDFEFSSLPAETLAAIKNGTITINTKVTGTAVGSGELITATAPRLVKIQPSFALNSRLFYSSGPFANTGPIPPKAESPTTYTVTWTIVRSPNGGKDAEVRATLPSYVSWTGKTSPGSENITWIPERNEVIWRVGDIPAGSTGQIAKEASFQVSLTPSFSQIGSLPDLVQNISLRVTDTFTSKPLTIGVPDLTTDLRADSRYTALDGTVRQ